MKDIQDINDIKLLVDEFYTKVRADETLAPVFAEVITGDWQPHLNIMYDFWNMVLFNASGYKGSPFVKHIPLKINKTHFERWIALFYTTIDQYFVGNVANEAKNRAHLMAEMFTHKLERIANNNGRMIV